jgi:hypothetical protein
VHGSRRAQPAETAKGDDGGGSALKTPVDRRSRVAAAAGASSAKRGGSSVYSATKASANKSVARRQLVPEEGSLSVRRREAIAGGGSTSGAAVDLGELQQLRERLSSLEHVLLQWAYLAARAERAAQKQEAAGRRELAAVWGHANEVRSRALAAAMEAAREEEGEAAQAQLRAQANQLLPLTDAVEQCLVNYRQLADSVASTSHALPLPSSAPPVDEAEVTAALAALDGKLEPPAGAAAAVAAGREAEATAGTARLEAEALRRCRELLTLLELRLMQRRSLLVDQLQQA